MRIAVIGAGWAGLAAAVRLSEHGHDVTVLEASRTLGGRARAIQGRLPDGTKTTLDNGQHILIGAYTETLDLMQKLGINPAKVLQRSPMNLRFPDDSGLQFPELPTPLDALAAILLARGWSWRDKLGLLQTTARWRRAGFQCDAGLTVAALCRPLAPRVIATLIEPLCVSALNTPSDRACAQVFLRVLHDALLGVQGGSHLLLPRRDLSALLPAQAARWLQQRGHSVRLGSRVLRLQAVGRQWRVDANLFDQVILATPVQEAARLLATLDAGPGRNAALEQWIHCANQLEFEAITTVYTWARGARLKRPMLALQSSETAPAQFVFDRGQLDGPHGLLAFVVSASSGELEDLQSRVLKQAQAQLKLELTAVKTVVEKRATFACTPDLRRPAMRIAPGLLACGDCVEGPYPATLEGAVRSGRLAAQTLCREPQ